MDHSLLVGFVICHFFALLLSGVLISLDVRAPRSSLKSDFEKPSAVFCGIAQVAILAAAVTSIAISLVNGQQVVWLEAAQFSVLQVHSGINVSSFNYLAKRSNAMISLPMSYAAWLLLAGFLHSCIQSLHYLRYWSSFTLSGTCPLTMPLEVPTYMK